MEKSNKRNKAKKTKVANTINFELLQDELRQNNKYINHKPNRKPNKRRADRR